MKTMLMPCFLFVLVVSYSPLLWAHKPVIINGGYTDASTAHVIDDIAVSQVGYHERTDAQPELWFTFEADAGATLYAQLGVPYLERYAGLRPAMALLVPGGPVIDVPFTVPEGYGGTVYPTEGETPDIFDEEFTGTHSWLFEEIDVLLPETGRYYLVAYLPGGEDGKFWMAVGKAEVFGVADILTLPQVLFQVRAFHEVGPIGGILFWAYLVLLLLAAGLFITLFKLVFL